MRRSLALLLLLAACAHEATPEERACNTVCGWWHTREITPLPDGRVECWCEDSQIIERDVVDAD